MRTLIITMVSLCIGLLVNPLSAMAKYDPAGGVTCKGQAASSAFCSGQTEENPISGSQGVLYRATKIVAFAAGAAAVNVVIVSSIRYITSGGDQQKIVTARNTLLNAAVGLIIVVLASALIFFVLGKLQ